jgi:Fic family protein
MTSEELVVIARIDEMKEKLGLSTRTPSRRWRGLLRRNSFARAVQGSNSIEGYNVTVDDAIAAVEGEEPLDATTEAWAAVTGYRDAMTYVLQLADDPGFVYSAELFRSLHFMMIKYDLAKHPGRWRAGPIFVRDEEKEENVYEGPPADSVAGLIDDLVADLNHTEGACIVRAAMAHLNFVMIHPFSDGNGRMARTLQALVLARDGNLDPVFCSIEEYLGRNTRKYYDVLAEVGGGAWHPERDARPWIRFCLTAHYRQVSTQLRRLAELAALWSAIEEEIAKRGLPERSIVALIDAAMSYRVRNSSYRKTAEVTEQVASRDLKELTGAGLLLPVGERRGRFYVASITLKQLVAPRQPHKIEDPFETPLNKTLPLPGM